MALSAMWPTTHTPTCPTAFAGDVALGFELSAAAFVAHGAEFVPKARQYTDPVRTFAYGTDASFYRLNPKLVLKVHSEEEVRKILPIAKKHGVPVTFRAAGTSLSGQALTDSVLIKISHTGKNFRNFTVHVSMLVLLML